jgi:DNA-binding transcriptional LysR family regulator
MAHDRLNGLVALKAVADTLNFTAAADTLGVSPSAVSQTIKQLEKRLGVALLARTTRSTSVTEAGERFLAQAGPALDQVLAALDEVDSYAKQPAGLLRLNLPRVVYAFHLAPLIANFTARHPEITVELFFEDQQSDIVKKGFDAGIRLSDILAKDVVAIKLYGPVRFVTFAAPHYLNRMGRPKHPKDLLSHDCIRLRLGTSLYDGWEFAHKGKEFQVQVKGSLIMNDSLLMLDAVTEGAGIGYASEEAVRAKVNAGKLEVVLGPFACSSAGFYLYYPRRHQVLPKLRAFIESIRRDGKGAGRSPPLR